MIRGRYLTSKDDVTDVLEIRRCVFVEEQGYSLDGEVDEYDKMSVYALTLDEDGNPVGTGRLYIDSDDHFAIGRVCVLKEVRNRGYGDLIMRMLLARALDLNAPSIYLSAQLDKTGFYEKYGFAEIGETYLEDGVPHIAMRVAREDVPIGGACG